MATEEIPARSGRAVRLKRGQSLKVINTHGHQVMDFWAFCDPDVAEFLSMEHLRATITTIFPRAGHDLYTNKRRPILHFAEDTSPGIHDTLMAACDNERYGLLGCTEYHDNCTDNLAAAQRFVDFMLGVDAQNDIPWNMFVFPVNEQATPPAEFVEFSLIPANPLSVPSEDIEANREAWIEEWTDIVVR